MTTTSTSYESISKTFSVNKYELKLTLTQYEKVLLTAALMDKIDERIKIAEFIDSDSANTYFTDAGRLQRIATKLARTTPIQD